jgi:small membrane protein
MTPFQIVALTALAAIVVWEFARLRRDGASGGPWLIRLCVWLVAAIAVAQPQLLQVLANLLGIGRGTDVLLYLLVFAFFGASFFLYARTVVLQRQLTQLVRRYALDNARRQSP